MTTPASDFVRDLARQLDREQNPPDYAHLADLCGTWHFVGSDALTLPSGRLGTFGSGEVVAFGWEGGISLEMIANSHDRHGRSQLVEWLQSEDAQLRDRSEVFLRPGGWPPGVLRVKPGTREYLEAAQAARKAARALPDASERTEAMREVIDTYGADAAGIPTTSRTVATYDGGNKRENLTGQR